MKPEMSVLVVNYNTWNECASAIHSLRQNPPRRKDGSVMRDARAAGAIS